jgi:hypothetical protein
MIKHSSLPVMDMMHRLAASIWEPQWDLLLRNADKMSMPHCRVIWHCMREDFSCAAAVLMVSTSSSNSTIAALARRTLALVAAMTLLCINNGESKRKN